MPGTEPGTHVYKSTDDLQLGCSPPMHICSAASITPKEAPKNRVKKPHSLLRPLMELPWRKCGENALREIVYHLFQGKSRGTQI